MRIKRVEKDDPEFEGYSVYEIEDPALNEPCYYLAVNNETKLVNIYSISAEGKPNRVDATVLKFRTDLPVTINRDGVLIFNKPEQLDQFLVDLLGDHAAILAQDMHLQFDKVASTEMGLDLSQQDPNGEFQTIDIDKYGSDPYAGLDPEVVDRLKELEGEGGDAGFDAGGEPAADDEELPPLDDFEEEEPGAEEQ